MAPSARSRRGSRTRARRWRRRRRLLVLLVALGVTAAAVYVGAFGRDVEPGDPTDATATAGPTPQPSVRPTVDPTPADVDLSALPIARTEFCDRLDPDDVEQALGGPVTSTYHYGNGDRRRLAPGVVDVSHEYNCSYRAATGDEARVWVFAEPVTRHEAVSLARRSTRQHGCSEMAAAPTYGRPSAATVCRERGPARRVATLRGLFGDAWLSCELTAVGHAGAASTAPRAERWCIRVATTLGARD